MHAVADLELIDCGGGRRLERFGSVVVDRSAPMADDPPRLPAGDWAKPDLRWSKGAWVRGAAHDPWPVAAAGLTLECRPAAGGQVGVFPEHAGTWSWLAAATRTAAERLGRPPEVLSLFAYTGGATLACARAGARVAHVDASRPAIAWARRNAELSGLDSAPVRWLVDDARAFVRRERRRGRRYDGVVLDPPTYGHGTGAWQIETDLEELLEDLAAIAGPRPSFVALSAHTPGWDGERLAALVRDGFGIAANGEPLELRARSGALLRLGAWARGTAGGDLGENRSPNRASHRPRQR
jgi:23S rRNA (cytosine1962-C5)-methyltransferase